MTRANGFYRTADRGEAAISAFARRREAALEAHGRVEQQNRRALLASALAVTCILVVMSWRFIDRDTTAGPAQGAGGTGGRAEAMRTAQQDATALRFGEVRVPLRHDLCTAYALDNWSGFFTRKSVRECHPPEEVVRVVTPSADSAARLRGVRNAFRAD